MGRMTSTFCHHQLPNGLRVVCEVMPDVRSAAIAFFVQTGSRDESPDEHGVSHFLEHMCFKGTARRTCAEINGRFDELGAIYNAFTSKEHTVYYGCVPAERVAPQVELLADMMRPTLPPDEYEMERKVVLEEIAMSADSFEHNVSDFAHHTWFDSHPLAHEILGEKETIAALPRERMVDYLAHRYAPENVVLLAAGAVDPQELFALAGRYCGHWQRGLRRVEDPPVAAAPRGVRKCVLPQFRQQSLMLAYPAPGTGAPEEETIDAFVSLFGGSNSRCYWNIVQQGICAQAGATWLAYRGTGALVFYADGEPDRCEQMLDALREQIAEVRRDGFRKDEVQRVRNRRRTQLAVEIENPRSRMVQLLDDLESVGYLRTPMGRLAAVDRVTPAAIARFLESLDLDQEGLLMSVGPRDWPS